jgi:hypothetical protein
LEKVVAKRVVSFRLKNNETCETACFASKQNFAKQQVCFVKHETCLVLCFAKYESKLVSLETQIVGTFQKTVFSNNFLRAHFVTKVSLHLLKSALNDGTFDAHIDLFQEEKKF